MKLVQRNLREAVGQSDSVVFDSRRIHRIPDKAIARELAARLPHIKGLRRIKFVNRNGDVVDIR